MLNQEQTELLTILSIFIAAVGGAPGILQIVDHFRRNARFGADLSSITTGEIEIISEDSHFKGCQLLLALTIVNSGERSIIPQSFNAYVLRGYRWVKLDRTLIPANLKLPSRAQRIETNASPDNDLQRYKGPIRIDTPVWGFIMFLTDAFTQDELRASYAKGIKFVCTDVFGKHYSTVIKKPMREITSSTFYPHHGVRVSPKRNEGPQGEEEP